MRVYNAKPTTRVPLNAKEAESSHQQYMHSLMKKEAVRRARLEAGLQPDGSAKELEECPICLTTLLTNENSATISPCGHTACAECVQEMVRFLFNKFTF